jgi:putative transposase
MRGVDGRQIFSDDEDRWHGIFGLYEFNTTEAISIRRQREKRKKLKRELKSLQGPSLAELEQVDKRTRLVDVLAFVFMPNHIHLLLKQLIPDGISTFVKKFGTDRAMHFNAKYKRIGTLFQGRFDARHIGVDDYLKTAFVYIHTNPISLIEPGWKEKGINNLAGAKEFLETYRWSSYLDYLGKKNFPSVTQRDFMLTMMGGPDGACQFVNYWLDCKHGLGDKLTKDGPC